jgi:dienelactone hydrolase
MPTPWHLALAFFVTFATVAPAAWADSPRIIDKDLPSYTVSHDRPYTGEGCGVERRCRDITLAAPGRPPVNIALSLPARLPAEGLPVVVILGGYRTGRKALNHIPDPGPNAVVTYEYPLNKETWDEGSWLAKIVKGRRAMHAVPDQVLAIVRWARAQPWAEAERTSVLGYSLGALFVPVAYRRAQTYGERLGPGIMAFGGAHLRPIIRANLRMKPAFARGLAAWLASAALRSLEPARHLPHLRGEFLLINAKDDERIPVTSVEAMQALTPEPKTVVNLSSGHLTPRDQKLMTEVVRLSLEWLLERGAINPMP